MPASNNGSKEQGFKQSEVKDGKIIATGTYYVQKPAECDECGQHDCDQKKCDDCKKNCEFYEKTIAGKKIKGCFEKDMDDTHPMGKENEGRRKSREGRVYLRGEELEQKDLKVV